MRGAGKLNSHSASTLVKLDSFIEKRFSGQFRSSTYGKKDVRLENVYVGEAREASDTKQKACRPKNIYKPRQTFCVVNRDQHLFDFYRRDFLRFFKLFELRRTVYARADDKSDYRLHIVSAYRVAQRRNVIGYFSNHVIESFGISSLNSFRAGEKLLRETLKFFMTRSPEDVEPKSQKHSD